jgi:hypothetical protein
VSIRRSIGLALLPIVVLGSGCATTASPPSATGKTLEGIVSGVASPCEGPYMPQAKFDAIKVRVQLLKDSRVVAEQTVTGSHTFHFAAPPGSYVVRSNQSATTPATVTVTDGQRKTVNLYSACM